MVAVTLSGCERVKQEVSKYDWDVSLMMRLAYAESNCNPNATGDTTLTYQENGRTYGYSVGAFQVRILPGREACDTHDIETNVRCAYNVWKGQSYSAWSTFTNLAYLRF